MSTERFIKYLRLQKRYSPHTLKSYQTDLGQFVAYFSHYGDSNDICQAKHHAIRGWIVSLMEQGLGTRSVNRKITTLKSFYKYMMMEGVISNNPTDKIISPKNKKRLPFFVEEKQMGRLLDELEFGKDLKGTRNKLIVDILYQTGMRRAELINIREIDVSLNGCTIKVTGKRNKERIIPINQSLSEAISSYMDMKATGTNDWLLVTDKGKKLYDKLVYRVITGYLQLVTTIDKKSPHVLRHTFATHMLNNGADLNAIKELLGHANLSATEVYTHNTFEKIRDIYNQAHPRG